MRYVWRASVLFFSSLLSFAAIRRLFVLMGSGNNNGQVSGRSGRIRKDVASHLATRRRFRRKHGKGALFLPHSSLLSITLSAKEDLGQLIPTLCSLKPSAVHQGELRCDVNVSVAKIGADGQVEQQGTRCEVKNLNGVRFIAGAVGASLHRSFLSLAGCRIHLTTSHAHITYAESEILRQIADLERGVPITQSTRGFDALTLSTFHLRSKESSPDYRYMPDPELGPVVLAPAALAALEAELPELPIEAEERLEKVYGLGKRECEVLVALGEGAEDANVMAAAATAEEVEMEPGIGVRWFEQLAQGRDPKKAANW